MAPSVHELPLSVNARQANFAATGGVNMPRSFLIIGAGVIGAATALQLAKAGHRVKIVHGGGAPATAAAFGWINASFFLDDDHHHLRAAGLSAWRRLLADVPVKVDWQGCLCWDMPEAQMQATYDQLRGFDYPVTMLDAAEVARREPALKTVPERALFFPTEGAAPSQVLAGRLLRAAQEAGAQVITNVAVHSILQGGDGRVGIATPVGEIMADQVIVAAGTGTQTLAASIDCHVPMVSRPAYIMRTGPQAPMLQHILATPEGEIRQEPSGQLLMPASVGHQGDSADRLTISPQEAADDAMRRLRGLVTGLADADWAEVIKADRPVPQDGFPVMGRIADGVHVCVLHSGITLGPLMAELVAKDITGTLSNAEAAMLAPYRPNRFSAAQ
jgi:glycine/D-amino acid oxidase-like deaminating enzyme